MIKTNQTTIEELTKVFEAKIANEEKIEPRDWMPDAYRQNLIRQMSQHAHSEVIGMQPEGNWLTRTPSLRAKKILLAKIQDEGGHGLYLYSAAETLGVSRDQFIQWLHEGKAKYASVFNYPTLNWADIGAIGWLVDGAAITNQVSLQKTSYGPYSRAMVRICKEESFHQRQGYEIMVRMMRGTVDQQKMAQDAIDRWWWPALMMFGPHDTDSQHTSMAMQWKIKRESNDQLREKFIQKTIPQAEFIGLKVPDSQIKLNADGTYAHGDIDWEEFWQVVNGQGICNQQRLNHHIKAHEEGAWVRERALNSVKKHTMKDKEKVKAFLLSQLENQIEGISKQMDAEHEAGIIDPNDTYDPEDLSQQDESNLMEDIFQRKMMEKRKELNFFKDLSFEPKSIIEPGAIVKTQRTTFVIGIASLPFDWEGERWMAISMKSPLCQQMKNKNEGDTFSFLNQEFTIEKIY